MQEWWDGKIAALLKGAARKARTVPTALCYAPAEVGGLGMSRLSDHVMLERAKALMHGLDNPEADEGAVSGMVAAWGRVVHMNTEVPCTLSMSALHSTSSWKRACYGAQWVQSVVECLAEANVCIQMGGEAATWNLPIARM